MLGCVSNDTNTSAEMRGTARSEQAGRLLQVYLTEYQKAKDEQIKRIAFRDNLLYVTLAVIGGVLSLVLAGPGNLPILLAVPPACLVLGWTYLVNDQKISAIGEYIRTALDGRIRSLLEFGGESLFGWELAHRSDKKRAERKSLQLIIDEITFVLSGLAAVFVFLLRSSRLSVAVISLSVVEILLLLGLAIQIAAYADLRRQRKDDG